jgi:glycosyltransferase involved in cell wall biosynthesis
MPKLLYVTTTPFFPDVRGGAELSTVSLFKALHARKWEIEVLCSYSAGASPMRNACIKELERRSLASLLAEDTDLGYTCYRFIAIRDAAHEWLKRVDMRLRQFRPDIVLGYPHPQCPLLNFAARNKYPSFYLAHNLAPFEKGICIPPNIQVIANSSYTASKFSKRTSQRIGVVLEIIEQDSYRVTRRQRMYITFINPIPEKGLQIATAIARKLPAERFLFVKGGWQLVDAQKENSYLAALKNLSNVTVWENQRDMRKVYGVTDILLVPSQVAETFGRIIVEAHVSGIPVVAANAGAIPFTLGRGGILVDPKETPDGYLDALRRLRQDEGLYLRLSKAALKNSLRPEFRPDGQVNNFLAFVESAISSQN